MRISKNRLLANCSTTQLRRARRLYKFLCAPAISAKPDYAIITAQRAKEAGLYAESYTLKDATFAMERGSYKRYKEETPIGQRDSDWLTWCGNRRDDSFWSVWEKAAFIQKKNGIKVTLKL